jgi:hypothetical protein
LHFEFPVSAAAESRKKSAAERGLGFCLEGSAGRGRAVGEAARRLTMGRKALMGSSAAATAS